MRPAAEHEVVLAFLSGEMDSPRFGSATRAALEHAGGVPLVTNPDLTSGFENAARRSALGEARGWPSSGGLFAEFPSDLSWQYAHLDVAEVERVRFINYPYWIELSGGSRSPADVAGVLERPEQLPPWLIEIGTDPHFAFAEMIKTWETLGNLIIVGTPDLGELVVLEGHARLAALFLSGRHRQIPVNAFVGTSPNIRAWPLF